MADTVTRFDTALFESAAAEGARSSRSAKQQLDHWARVGRAVTSQQSVARRRVEAALTGRLPAAELSPEEGVVFNAEIAASVEEHLAVADYPAMLAAEGIATVSLDAAGRMVEHRPDGSTRILPAR